MLLKRNDKTIACILEVIPARLAQIIGRYIRTENVEEIRFRINRPVQLLASDKDVLLTQYGTFSYSESSALLHRLCMGSVYALEDELVKGYVTITGGARVGLCGRPVVEHGRIVKLTDIQGFNIRIPYEAYGCAEPLVNAFIMDGRPATTIIAAPPGVGKTTFLRDLARCLSDGKGIERGYRTAIADERNELSGSVEAVPMLDIGARTDVMSLAAKSESIPMLIRSMNPEVVLTDEIMTDDDYDAISDAACHGVSIIATVHARSFREMRSIPQLNRLLENGVIKRAWMLKRQGSAFNLIGENGGKVCGD